MNLLAPDLLCEFHIWIRHDGSFDITSDKIDAFERVDLVQLENMKQVCNALFALALKLGEPYGLKFAARVKDPNVVA